METLLFTALVMGFLGGVHCVAMCGGIIGAISLRPSRSSTGLHLSYNLGRIASYALAGAFAGTFGSIGALLGGMLPWQMALVIIANAIVMMLGLHIAGWGRAIAAIESIGAAFWRRVQPAGRRLLPVDTLAKALGVGLLWGWIPCGLVYSALALALVSGTASRGTAVMLAFGAGTVPNLLATGMAAQRVGLALRHRWVRAAAGTFIVSLGIIGLVRVPGLQDAIRNGLLCLA